ncbi:MAG: glycerol-3-phosphate acyltransferase, partial [Candidatus Heritagella sp.]
MEIFLFAAAAVCAYLIGGLNPAIVFSRRIYKRDIRTCGSGNPGFTNFKRTFGNRLAWLVLVLDLTKAAAVAALFAQLFAANGYGYQLGASYTGLFAMLGHAYPPY